MGSNNEGIQQGGTVLETIGTNLCGKSFVPNKVGYHTNPSLEGEIGGLGGALGTQNILRASIILMILHAKENNTK